MSRRRFTLPITLAVLMALAGCGGGSPSTPTESTASTATDQCSTLGQVEFVRTTLQDIYLWYMQLPDPDPAGFNSPEAYLDAVRYRPIDTSYSYIASKAASDAFFSDSQFIGIGVSYRQTGASELRVAQTFPGSPAADAGMTRSDYILAINGTSVAQLLSTGGVSAAFGPDQEGVQVTMRWRAPGGPELEATLVKRKVTIPTVSATAVFDVGGMRVGYIFFRNLRDALGRGAQHGLRPAAGGGRHGSRARSPLQRRRVRERGAAPGEPDRRTEHIR